MTFYAEQIRKINLELYPKNYLTKRVIFAKQYIDGHFEDDIYLIDLSTRAFISKFHFIRLFKQLYGITPHQYLISVRIENAKRMLLVDKPVSTVCAAVGLGSCTSFTRLFKKITGFSPAAFKKNNFKKSNFYELLL